MCISKVPGYLFAGKLFLDELDAVNTALETIATNIITENADRPHFGLIRHSDDLVWLLRRRAELCGSDSSEVSEVASGKHVPPSDRTKVCSDDEQS